MFIFLSPSINIDTNSLDLCLSFTRKGIRNLNNMCKVTEFNISKAEILPRVSELKFKALSLFLMHSLPIYLLQKEITRNPNIPCYI